MAKNKAPKKITFGSRLFHLVKLLVLGLIEVAGLIVAIYPFLNVSKDLMTIVTAKYVQIAIGLVVHVVFLFWFACVRKNWNLRKLALAAQPAEEVAEETEEAEEVAVEEEVVAAEEEVAPAPVYPQIIIHEYDNETTFPIQ